VCLQTHHGEGEGQTGPLDPLALAREPNRVPKSAKGVLEEVISKKMACALQGVEGFFMSIFFQTLKHWAV
jgi:hypothetical protein